MVREAVDAYCRTHEQELSCYDVAKRAGVRLVHVPYRGGGPSLNDAVAGHVDLMSGTAALVSSQVSAGALRPLLQTGAGPLPRVLAVQRMARPS